MNFSLFQRVVLTRDIPEGNLKEGDIVTIVENLSATEESKGEPGFALEAFNVLGETTAVVFAPVSAVKPLEADEILHIRKIAVAV